jgi:hypothetical protein
MDVGSGKVFRSPFLTSSRNVEDRFIYSGWKKYVKENGLRFKDKLIFNAPYGDNRLEIEVVRQPVL